MSYLQGAVLVYSRDEGTGQLAFEAHVPTTGTGGLVFGDPGLSTTGSIRVAGNCLLAVNPRSNDVSAFCIQVYSIVYMATDPGKGRFFAFLGLFEWAMLSFVYAPNLLQSFIFWELVGLASFLLIGFWYHKPSAVAAAKKARDEGTERPADLKLNEFADMIVDKLTVLADPASRRLLMANDSEIESTTLDLVALNSLCQAGSSR